jgi:hypothetical protein
MTLAVQRNITLKDALRDAEARYVEANPKSARHDEACAAMPGGNAPGWS